jgi:eukaryotic-like serine/threonine-protein kinase
MKFTYSSGQRPLDGYTIKRGIGRGGFGEVYYGLSDGGKEVALKLVQGNLDIELRGMSQCLNFKHPNLVGLYDMRTDGHGDHWVVMEYVSGETLNTVLCRHPSGVAPELAQQWFSGLAAAVSYLHDHGIVHRDLKPGNIFVESGSVKVGDYGLCKFISGSQRTAQTQSVGTVHYMAPEISTGNYNKQIDIYAAGVILYEMLTGHVPFDGESAGEILMKHLTSPPDLSKVPVSFVPVLDRALCKNPAQRYRSMAEMSRDVAAIGQAGAAAPPVARPAPGPQPVSPAARGEQVPMVHPLTVRTQVNELCGSMLLSVVLAALLYILWAGLRRPTDLTEIGSYFFLTVATCWAVLIPAKLWTKRVHDSLPRRVLMMCLGLVVGLEALWLDGQDVSGLFNGRAMANEVPEVFRPDGVEGERPEFRNGPPAWFGNVFRAGQERPPAAIAAGYLSFFGLALFALRWWRMADRRRPQRFSLYYVVAAVFWTYLLFYIFRPWSEERMGGLVVVMTAVIVQLVSPWQQPTAPPARRLRLRQT